MRLFVLTYDRRRKQLVSVRNFRPGQYAEANRCLSEAEFRSPDIEVVLLEAASIEDLRLTHRRYFEDPGLTDILVQAAS